MTTNINTLVTPLMTQQQGPLGTRLAAHLLRRCSFHFSKERVDELALLDANAAVDLLFDSASPAPYMVRPLFNDDVNNTPIQDWIDDDTNTDEVRKRRAVCAWWLRNSIFDPTAHHKVAMFLHTTFSTSHDGLVISGNGQSLTRDVSRFLYDHLRLLNWLTTNGISLKKAARKITLDNLMLGYLNNRLNINNGNGETGLNENYGREFLELFTIGRGAQISPGIYENYTEADVTMAARVFSGFSTENRRNLSTLDPETGIPAGTAFANLHYNGPKAFSNKFVGANNPVDEPNMDDELDTFIEMVFDQPATALNYANKIYRFFVAIEIDAGIAQEMATELVNNAYDYIAVLKLLFKSEHFYSICSADPDYFNGNLLKSPQEMLSEALSFFKSDLPPFVDSANPTIVEVYDHFFRFTTSFLFNRYGEDSGMKMFSPPSVAGFPAYYQEPTFDQNWYSGGTIPTRYGLGQKLVKDWNVGPNIKTRIDSVAYADYLSSIGIDVSVADDLLDEVLYLFPQEISQDRRDLIKGIFLENLSPINWSRLWKCYEGDASFCEVGFSPGNASSVRPHLDALIIAVLSAHEFQLK